MLQLLLVSESGSEHWTDLSSVSYGESKGSVLSLRNAGRLFHAVGPAQENALKPAVISL